MKYEINTLVSTLVDKKEAKSGSVGAIIGQKEEKGNTIYLVEIFTIRGHEHLQLFYNENELYKIDNA